MRSRQSVWLGVALLAASWGCSDEPAAGGQAVAAGGGTAPAGGGTGVAGQSAGSGMSGAGAAGGGEPSSAGGQTAAGGSAAAAGADGAAAGTSAAGSGAGGADAAGSGAGGASAPAPVKGSPTFGAIYRDIFVGKGCTGSAQCHAGPAGGLSLGSQRGAYDRLVDKPAMGMNLSLMPPHCAESGLKRVVPGDPDNSLLIQKIEDKQPCGLVMPPNPPLLEAAEVQQIRTWIMNGAKDD